MHSLENRGRRQDKKQKLRIFNGMVRQVLTRPEQEELQKVLGVYQAHRQVELLISSLRGILNTPAKLDLLMCIRDFVPPLQVSLYDKLAPYHQMAHPMPPPGGSPAYHSNGTVPRRYAKTQQMSPQASAASHHASPKINNYQTGPSHGMEIPDTGSLHSITLVKLPGQGLGFCVRGGSEHGLGIYVSEVEAESPADICGLQKGDCILEVNNVSFEKIASSSAVKVFTGNSKLKMLVRRVGKIPGHKYAQEKTIWYDTTRGELVQGNLEDENTISQPAGLSHLDGIIERSINLHLKSADQFMGFNIRGGKEYNIGIYVSKVDPGGLAEKKGLKIGDQITFVNKQSLEGLAHTDVVKLIRASMSQVVLTVRDVGRYPAYKERYIEHSWIDVKTGEAMKTRSGHIVSIPVGPGSPAQGPHSSNHLAGPPFQDTQADVHPRMREDQGNGSRPKHPHSSYRPHNNNNDDEDTLFGFTLDSDEDNENLNGDENEDTRAPAQAEMLVPHKRDIVLVTRQEETPEDTAKKKGKSKKDAAPRSQLALIALQRENDPDWASKAQQIQSLRVPGEVNPRAVTRSESKRKSKSFRQKLFGTKTRSKLKDESGDEIELKSSQKHRKPLSGISFGKQKPKEKPKAEETRIEKEDVVDVAAVNVHRAVIEHEAKRLLTPDEADAIMRHLSRYENGGNIQELVMPLSAILDDKEKSRILTHVRKFIREGDKLTYDREVQNLTASLDLASNKPTRRESMLSKGSKTLKPTPKSSLEANPDAAQQVTLRKIGQDLGIQPSSPGSSHQYEIHRHNSNSKVYCAVPERNEGTDVYMGSPSKANSSVGNSPNLVVQKTGSVNNSPNHVQGAGSSNNSPNHVVKGPGNSNHSPSYTANVVISQDKMTKKYDSKLNVYSQKERTSGSESKTSSSENENDGSAFHDTSLHEYVEYERKMDLTYGQDATIQNHYSESPRHNTPVRTSSPMQFNHESSPKSSILPHDVDDDDDLYNGSSLKSVELVTMVSGFQDSPSDSPRILPRQRSDTNITILSDDTSINNYTLSDGSNSAYNMENHSGSPHTSQRLDNIGYVDSPYKSRQDKTGSLNDLPQSSPGYNRGSRNGSSYMPPRPTDSSRSVDSPFKSQNSGSVSDSSSAVYEAMSSIYTDIGPRTPLRISQPLVTNRPINSLRESRRLSLYNSLRDHQTQTSNLTSRASSVNDLSDAETRRSKSEDALSSLNFLDDLDDSSAVGTPVPFDAPVTNGVPETGSDISRTPSSSSSRERPVFVPPPPPASPPPSFAALGASPSKPLPSGSLTQRTPKRSSLESLHKVSSTDRSPEKTSQSPRSPLHRSMTLPESAVTPRSYRRSNSANSRSSSGRSSPHPRRLLSQESHEEERWFEWIPSHSREPSVNMELQPMEISRPASAASVGRSKDLPIYEDIAYPEAETVFETPTPTRKHLGMSYLERDTGLDSMEAQNIANDSIETGSRNSTTQSPDRGNSRLERFMLIHQQHVEEDSDTAYQQLPAMQTPRPPTPKDTQQYKQYITVHVRKDKKSLGLSISGGMDSRTQPRIKIDHIFPGGAASEITLLQKGLEIVSVDGISLKNVTHAFAVNMFRKTFANKAVPTMQLVIGPV